MSENSNIIDLLERDKDRLERRIDKLSDEVKEITQTEVRLGTMVLSALSGIKTDLKDVNYNLDLLTKDVNRHSVFIDDEARRVISEGGTLDRIKKTVDSNASFVEQEKRRAEDTKKTFTDILKKVVSGVILAAIGYLTSLVVSNITDSSSGNAKLKQQIEALSNSINTLTKPSSVGNIPETIAPVMPVKEHTKGVRVKADGK